MLTLEGPGTEGTATGLGHPCCGALIRKASGQGFGGGGPFRLGVWRARAPLHLCAPRAAPCSVPASSVPSGLSPLGDSAPWRPTPPVARPLQRGAAARGPAPPVHPPPMSERSDAIAADVADAKARLLCGDPRPGRSPMLLC